MTDLRWIRQLAVEDRPLEALALLDGMDDPDAVALREALQRRTAHLESFGAYHDFYNEPAPERPYFPFAMLAQLPAVMPRWAVVRAEVLAQGARSLLELGSFDGFCSLNLALTAGIPCVAVDVNRAAIEECVGRAERLKVPVRGYAGLIELLDLPERFDAVLCLEVLEHVRDVDAVLAVAERHLAPGGRVYVSAPLTAPAHQHEREAREHVRLFDAAAMTALLTGPGRELVWYERLRTPDGWHHCGAYEVAG